jgi:inner membrane protein
MGYNEENDLVTDIRYSMIPNQIAPMWGLVIDKKLSIDEHASWWTSQSLNQSQLKLFKEMLRGKACEVF